MIVDLRDVRTLEVASDTVVVVGSGAAGLALSERLSAAGRQVILLESGADTTAPDDEARELNHGTSSGLEYGGLTEGRTRILGGTTELWHGQCMRLHPLDLQERSWVANSGWPIDLTDLDRYYADAERWIGVTGLGYGPQRWAEHAKLPPIAWNPDHLLHDFTEYTARPLLGREHRAGLAADDGIRVVLNATVAAVLTDAQRVTGVRVLDRDARPVEILADQVVLAAGALENARLLQLSDPAGIGLGAGREHTGHYLQDHPIIRMGQVLPVDYRFLQDRYVALHKGSRRLFAKVRLSPEAQERHGLLDATAVFVHDHDQPALAAARRLVLAARARRAPQEPWRDIRTALRAPAPVVRDTYRRYVRGLSTGVRPSAVWLQLWLEQTPDPQSRITLGTATDRLGLRKPEVHWRSSDQERETSRRLAGWVADDLRRLGIASVVDLPPMHDDDAWRASVTDAAHPSGTTRMALSPEHGVVDADLEVHGVRGLSVVGGSVFPVSGYANPTLTIVALALRLADRLAAREGAAPIR